MEGGKIWLYMEKCPFYIFPLQNRLLHSQKVPGKFEKVDFWVIFNSFVILYPISLRIFGLISKFHCIILSGHYQI